MQPSLTHREKHCSRAARPASEPSHGTGAEAAWETFLDEAHLLLGAPAPGERAGNSPAVRRLAGALAARFGEAAFRAANGGGRNGSLKKTGAEGWLDRWRFVPSDTGADPARRRLGPEAMARFHEAFAGGLGCVYTASGEVRFMARRALAECLSGPHPEIPPLPRTKAFALAGARASAIARIAAKLSDAERRTARARLRALRAIDPACGAGAFLLGLLDELARLQGALAMGSPAAVVSGIVTENLFGIDVDPGAVEIARRRLSLAGGGARPNLVAGDTLARDAAQVFRLPGGGRALPRRPGRGEEPRFDLVIGNPPYLRQERLGRRAHAGAAAGREVLAGVVRRWGGAPAISRRADLYVYFFLEGLRLLRPGGTLAFLTSHAWLDLDYGGALRAFLLEKADLPLLLESDHPSFRQASVNTVVTIATRRGSSKGARGGGGGAGSPVRFARIRQPCGRAAENPLFSALDGRRSVEKKNLRLRLAERAALAPPAPDAPAPRWGGLWLRGPAVYLRALERSAGRTVPLGEIADVVFGLKTGCNEFFYLDEEGTRGAAGGESADADDLRRYRSRLDGNRYVIESRYLSPVVTTLKEVTGLEVRPATLPRRVLVIPPGADPARARLAAYLRAGRAAGVHRRASVASRDPWFVLTPPRGAFLIPRRIGGRMPVARTHGTAFDNNLFGITPRPGVDPVALHAVLNATITRLCVELAARELTGAQAVVDTNVYLVKAIPVPRPDLLRSRKDELSCLLNHLMSRSARSIFDEMGAEDRNALDALVLFLWGLPAREVTAVQAAVADLAARRLAKSARGAGAGRPARLRSGRA